jgi:DNA-binding CsgD family transcriptional regulator
MKSTYSVEALSELIRQCYVAATAPDLWPRFLENLSLQTGSSSACMPVFGDTPAVPREMSHGVPEALQEEYARDLAEIDLAGAHARRCPDFVGSTSELFARHPTLRVPDFEARVGYYGLAERWGANLSPDVAIGLHRERALGAYEAPDTQFLGHLLPHLRNAISVGQQLAAAEQTSRALLDHIGQLGIGVLLLDKHAQVLMTNPRAEVILRDTETFRLSERRLRGLAPAVDTSLQLALTDVMLGLSPAKVMRAQSQTSTVELLCSPFRWPEETAACPVRSAPRFVVFLSDSDHMTDFDPSTLDALYALSPAESDTLHMVVNGYRLSEIAQLRGIRISTVRTQVSALLTKTGCEGQTQLTALAMRSVARLPAGRSTPPSATGTVTKVDPDIGDIEGE